MRSMGLAVFGPLALEGVTLSPRERSVLSALVLRAGRPVTTDELADALWGDEPPGTWAKQLQASVGRVRNAIGRDAIETTPGAYLLRIDPESIDVQRFEQYAASARLHLDDDPARALDADRGERRVVVGGVEDDLGRAPAGRERRPAVRERLHQVGLGRLESAHAEGAPLGGSVRAVLARAHDRHPLARERVEAELGPAVAHRSGVSGTPG